MTAVDTRERQRCPMCGWPLRPVSHVTEWDTLPGRRTLVPVDGVNGRTCTHPECEWTEWFE